MVKALILSALLSGEMYAITMPPDKIEARRRNSKGKKKRRRGGNGLR